MSSEDKAAVAETACERVREDFAALLDRELAPDEQESVEAHLSECAECLRDLDGLKRVDTIYRDLPPVGAAPGFEEAIRSSLEPQRVRLRPRRVPWTVYGPALAAAILLLVVGLYVLLPNTGEDRFNAASQLESEESVTAAETAPATGFADSSAASMPAPSAVSQASMPASTAEVQADLVPQEKGLLPVQAPGTGFALRDGVYVQDTYVGEDAQKLGRDSQELKELILEHPKIKDYVQWKRAVLFEIGGKWYSLEAAETPNDTP